MPKLHERDLVALLLVKAVEEEDPALFSREALSESALSAVDAADDAALLAKRSSVLFLHLPRPLRAWAHVGLLPEHSVGAVAVAAFLVGALSNYLGPARLVHVVYNPLAFLILWNLGFYVMLAWRRSSRRRDPGAPRAATAAALPPLPRPGPSLPGARADAARGRLLAFALPGAWLAWQRVATGFRSGRGELAQLRKVGARFWPAYWRAAGGVVAARAHALLHLGAIALLVGGVAGIYFRIFFFDYLVVWESTLLKSPHSIARFLNAFLGPACLILDGALLSPEVVQPLLLPEGSPAAAWIHRLALTGVLVVALPRALLAARAARRASRLAAGIELDFSEPYFAETLRAAREGVIHRVREGIALTVRLEIARFSAAIAHFVQSRFFDQIAAPALIGFRNRGGRVAELESELAQQRARFEPELEAQLRACDAEFRERVAAGVREVAGAELAQAPAATAGLAPGSLAVDPRLAGGVAASVGDAVGMAVTAAATAAVAALSGGIGKTLGVAILSTLLHTSGPIGLLIGGIAALATFGAAFALGRERVAAAAKGWWIPAPIAAFALRDSKLEAARAATYQQVEQEIRACLEPQVTATTEAVLRQLSLALRADEIRIAETG